MKSRESGRESAMSTVINCQHYKRPGYKALNCPKLKIKWEVKESRKIRKNSLAYTIILAVLQMTKAIIRRRNIGRRRIQLVMVPHKAKNIKLLLRTERPLTAVVLTLAVVNIAKKNEKTVKRVKKIKWGHLYLE